MFPKGLKKVIVTIVMVIVNVNVNVKVSVTAPLFSLGVSAGDTEAVQKKTRKNAML